MGTPLLHDLLTTPSPLTTGGQGALLLYVKNFTPEPHTLDRITLTLPTDVWAGGKINFKAPANWSGTLSPEGGGVTFKPDTADPIGHGETRTFVLSDIPLQSSPTIGWVSFHESVDGTEYDTLGAYVILGDVAPSDVRFTGPKTIDRGESALLSWAGPDHATYTLDPGAIDLASRCGTYPIAPTSTTTYTLTVSYTDPETGDTHTTTPQWTVMVNVPSAKVHHFDACPTSLDSRADGSRVLRIHCEVDIESAVHAAIVQVAGVNPDHTENTSTLWSKSDSEEGGVNGRYTMDLDVPVHAYNELTFRLTASSDPASGAGDVSSGDVTFTTPTPRIMAFAAPQLHGGQFPSLLVATQWSAGSGIANWSGASLPTPNGVFVLDTTPADRDAYLAGATRQTADGQLATVDGPSLQLHGLDNDEYDLRAHAPDDLTALNTVNRLFHYLDTGEVLADNPDGNDLRNGLIYNLSDQGGWSSESAGTLQGLGDQDLVDRWLVTAFLRRLGHTQHDLGPLSCDAQQQALCDWCAQAHATVKAWPDFARVGRRAQVGTAITLWEMNNPPFVPTAHEADVMAPLVALLTPPMPRWALWKLLCPLLCRIKAQGDSESRVLVALPTSLPEVFLTLNPWSDGDVTQLWSIVVVAEGPPRGIQLLHASTGLFLQHFTMAHGDVLDTLVTHKGTCFTEMPQGGWVALDDETGKAIDSSVFTYINLADNDFDPPWSPRT